MQREHQKQQHGSNGTVFSFAMVPHKNYTDVAGTGPGAPRGAAFGSPRSKGPDGDPRSTKRPLASGLEFLQPAYRLHCSPFFSFIQIFK